MKVMAGISKTIDKIVKAIGTAAAYISIVIMLLMVFEVFSRRIFHSPTIWSYETVSFLFGGMIMLSLPYGLQLGVNVRVDVLYNSFSKKLKNVMDILTFLVFFGIFILVFTEAGIKYFSRSLSSLERSWSAWAPLLWPVKATIPACGILMLLQGVSELIKMVFRLLGKGEMLGLADEEIDKVSEELSDMGIDVAKIEAENKEKFEKELEAAKAAEDKKEGKA